MGGIAGQRTGPAMPLIRPDVGEIVNRGAVDCNRGAGPLDEHIRLASVLGNLVAIFGQLSKANIWHNSVLLPFSKANH